MILVEAEIAICSARSAGREKVAHACAIPHTVTHLEDSTGVASNSPNLRQDCDCALCKACQSDEAFPAARANAA